jgi:hypothetical protein
MTNGAVKLLFFLAREEMGINLKDRNIPGVSLPYIGRGGG